MLQPNLLRSGVDLKFDTDLLYLDVNARRVGVGTEFPTHALTVAGPAKLDQITVDGTEIRALAGPITLATESSPVIVTSGTPNSLVWYGPNNELFGSLALTYDGESLGIYSPTTIQGTSFNTGSIQSAGPLEISTVDGDLTLSAGGNGSVIINNLSVAGLDPNKVIISDAAGDLSSSPDLTFSIPDSVFTAFGVSISNSSITSASQPLTLVSEIVELTANSGVVVTGANPTSIFYASPGDLTSAPGALKTSTDLTFTGTDIIVGNIGIGEEYLYTINGADLTISPEGSLMVQTTIHSTVGSGNALMLAGLDTDAGGIYQAPEGNSLRIAAGNTPLTEEYSEGNPPGTPNIAVDIGHFSTVDGSWVKDFTVFDNGTTITRNESFAAAATIGEVRVSNSEITTLSNDLSVSPGTGITVFTGTGGIVLPVGDISERPPTPETGTTRYNAELSVVEMWNGVAWIEVGPNYVTPISMTFSGDGSTVYFPMPQPVTATGVIVSINGVVQIPGAAYAIIGTDATTLALDSPPVPGDIVEVRIINGSTTLLVELSNPIIDGGFF